MNNNYPFPLIPLNYEYSALEPYIDEKTMRIHHDKHLKTYVDNLNNILEKYPEYHNWRLETFLCNLYSLPESLRTSIRNNAGGVYNHNLYFSLLSANSNTNLPFGNVKTKIIKDFGSIDDFKNAFISSALNQFGSGYTWLTIDRNNNLKIFNTNNQDCALSFNLYPILLVDVWEHAYYLKYQNRRKEYLENFFNIINWQKVENLYNKFFSKL